MGPCEPEVEGPCAEGAGGSWHEGEAAAQYEEVVAVPSREATREEEVGGPCAAAVVARSRERPGAIQGLRWVNRQVATRALRW